MPLAFASAAGSRCSAERERPARSPPISRWFSAMRSRKVLSPPIRFQRLESLDPENGIFLSEDEFAAMAEALTALEAEGVNPVGIAVLRLLLLTGARPSEIEQF